MMYDTLMQMGRWFGYRPAYEDLCRVWMPEEAEGWYAHIAESIEMLRDEIRSMEAAGATPEEFGLKVRSHPDNLIVTARSKMGSGERVVVNIGLGNQFVETAILRRDETSLAANRAAVRRLAEQLAIVGSPLADAERVSGSGWLLRNVPVDPILDFLAQFRNHDGSFLTAGEPIRRYIRVRSDSELASWDILFASVGRKNGDTLSDESLGILVNCQRRTAGNRSDQTTLRVTNKQRVASRGVEKTGLTHGQIAAAEVKYRQGLATGGDGADTGRAFNYPDRIYRRVRERPLLIIHLLKIDPEVGGKEHREPVVAWSISFPGTQMDEKRVEYVVNTTWLRENYRDDVDEEEMGGDDDG